MTVPSERRASVRHTPVNAETKVQLMDWTGGRITSARLVDISQHGALLLADQQPELDRPLHVWLEDATELGWILAIPVRFGQSREVGLRFNRPCSPDFLWEATGRRQIRSTSNGEEETQVGDLGPEYLA